ncbi:TIGR04206 family protein [Halosegnis sp.]|uniref:TIGR04206 family protein n=1 Tax=Halosegnis sp. TaxID=2864959 RepID=UPI0035D4C489
MATQVRGQAHATPRRRLLAVGLLGLVPWTVLLIDYGGPTVVNALFPLAVVDYNPALAPAVRVTPVWRFFAAGGGLPRNPELWPASILLHGAALASAAAGLADREDPRLTGGLLAFAGLAGLGVTLAFAHRLRYTPLPAGALLACALAWWYYGPALQAAILAPIREP